jgi:RHS repeat-associated protein
MKHKRKSPSKYRKNYRTGPSLEALETRFVLAVDWQNATNPLNINNDEWGLVSPIDAILIINELDQPRVSEPITGKLPVITGTIAPPPYFDADGDGFISPIDAVQVINGLDGQYVAPILVVALLNDTAQGGSTNADNLTSDARILGRVTDEAGSNVMVTVRVNDGTESRITPAADGTFVFDPHLGGDGVDDGEHTIVITATDRDGQSAEQSVTFRLDTVAPPIDEIGLAMASRLSPENSRVSIQSTVVLDGATSSAVNVRIVAPTRVTTSDADGRFELSNVPLIDGLNAFTVEVEDTAGNVRRSTISVAKTAPTPPPNTPTAIELGEGTNWLQEHAFLVELKHDRGGRQLSFDVASSFDKTDTDVLVGDLFQVYLVDPTSPGTTLLDRGREGESLFSLSETGADFLPGLVTFDGQRVTVDVSSLKSASQGILVLQLVNGDGDDGSRIEVSDFINVADMDGGESPALAPIPVPTEFPDSVDLTRYHTAMPTDVTVSVENVRVDRESGRYLADIQLWNLGAAMSRQVVLRWKELPPEVTVINATGRDGANGQPYLNVAAAIPAGGLDRGAMSSVIGIELSNPSLIRFELDLEVLTTGPNSSPVLASIPDATVMPGDVFTVDLTATDADGDPVYFLVANAQELPRNMLKRNTLTITPTPEDIGMYTVIARAKDGLSFSEQRFTLNVVRDPVTTTRLSGWIMDSDGVTPLPGVPVEVKGITTLTDDQGQFSIEATELTADDVVQVRANEVDLGGKIYPFVAEKLGLVLETGPFEGANNIIQRPIYLPQLDVAGGTSINSAIDTTVSQEILPGAIATVFVSQGSLVLEDGTTPFSGILSITAVPPEFTPAALPKEFHPSIVVTIQPGEMRFTDPAELTLPNPEGYLPGTQMNLWSINPVTGRFDNVGVGQVSTDGKSVETISGGIRNSSWHFFSPRPPRPPQQTIDDDLRNQKLGCGCSREATKPTNSELELHSGAIREQHSLVSYSTLGTSFGLTLHYNSQRADPRPIIHFGLSGDLQITSTGAQDLALVGRVMLSRGQFSRYVEGFGGNPNVPVEFEHFWTLPDSVSSNQLYAAAQGDLTDQPSGVYNATAENTLYIYKGIFAGNFAGTVSSASVPFVHVNSINSPFGAGWELGGLQQIVENPEGEILLIDGNGDDLVFLPPTTATAPFYRSPPGDFTQLQRNPGDGTYTRTTTDRTVYEFDAEGRLTHVRDRNKNTTEYVYDNGRIVEIRDPLGKSTRFAYEGVRVSTITDPMGRATNLKYNELGQLVTITDPDSSARNFGYDTQHHLTQEIDQEHRSEITVYGSRGRAEQSLRKDGTKLDYQPLQTALLKSQIDNAFPQAGTGSPSGAVPVTDGRGSVTRTTVDQAGQYVSSFDEIGRIGGVTRNARNLIERTRDGNGFIADYTYDARGNITIVRDDIIKQSEEWRLGFIRPDGPILGDPQNTFGSPDEFVTADFNSDGLDDVATLDDDNVRIYFGQGGGTFSVAREAIATGANCEHLAVGQLHPGDQRPDLVVACDDGSNTRVFFIHNRNGQQFSTSEMGTSSGTRIPGGVVSLAVADYDQVSGGALLAFAMESATSTDLRVYTVTPPKFSFSALEIRDTTELSDSIRFPRSDEKVSVRFTDGTGDLIVTGFPLDEREAVFLTTRLPTRLVLVPAEWGNQGTYNETIATIASADYQFGNVVVLAHASGDLTLLQRDTNCPCGRVVFFPFASLHVPHKPTSVVMDDFDSDGRMDIVTASDVSGDVYVIRGGGPNGFYEPVKSSDLGVVDSLLTGRFETGSVPDILAIDSHTGIAHMMLGRIGGTRPPSGRLYTYDPTFSQLTSVTDELGRVTAYEVDPESGNRKSSTLHIPGAASIIEHYTYTTHGLPETITDPLGRVTRYEYYDNSWLVRRITFAAGTSEEATNWFEYDVYGNRTAMIDENENRTEYKYDIMNRLIETKGADPDGPKPSPITTYEYDKRGNHTKTIDAEGSFVKTSYDEMDRVSGTEDNKGNKTVNTYDMEGNLKTSRDQNGHVTTHGYDARNRLRSTKDPDNGVTIFTYDLNDNLKSITDPSPLRNTTYFDYDSRDRLTREADPFGATMQYDYDAVDNLIKITDRNDRVTRRNYDAADRVTTEVWWTKDAVGLEVVKWNEIQYTYDAASNLKSISDNVSALSYTYDARDRITHVTNAGTLGATGLPTVELKYTYDRFGNKKSVAERIAGNAGATTNYDYDSLHRLTSVSQSGTGLPAKLVDLVYNQIGQFEQVSRYSDLSRANLVTRTTYDYDDLNRLTLLDHIAGPRLLFSAGEPLASVTDSLNRFPEVPNLIKDAFAANDVPLSASARVTLITTNQEWSLTDYPRRYVIREEGNVLNIYTSQVSYFAYDYDDESRITDITDIDGKTSYEYDDRDQLTGADRGASDIRGDETYDYDGNGNRLSSHLHSNGYETDKANRLKSDGKFRYDYDDEGNMIKRTDLVSEDYRTMAYDHRNRLYLVRDVAKDGTLLQQVEYVYDATDRRIARRVVNVLGQRMEHFVYDGQHVLLDFVDVDGTESAAVPELTRRYLFGPGIDNILSQDVAGSTQWTLTDHLGTVRDIVDSSAVSLNHIVLDSFGNIVSPDAGLLTRYVFTGREFDAATDLYYYRARFYDAAIGRFVSEDPLRRSAGDENYYRYVGNDPNRKRDPFGLVPSNDMEHVQNYLQDLRSFGKAFGYFLPGTGQLFRLIDSMTLRPAKKLAGSFSEIIREWERQFTEAEKELESLQCMTNRGITFGDNDKDSRNPEYDALLDSFIDSLTEEDLGGVTKSGHSKRLTNNPEFRDLPITDQYDVFFEFVAEP